MKKRIISFLLALTMLMGMMPVMATEADAVYTWITDRTKVKGSDYTKSSALAAKLDSIFDGNASVYSDNPCKTLVNTKLGTSNVKNDDIPKFVGPQNGAAINIGTSCWIYANGVYYTLFGECTANGTPGGNSEKLAINSTSSQVATYSNFKAWGVRQGVGALIRANGHSMIVLGYDANTLTILDGNGDNKGLVSIRVRSWDQVGFTVSYIIQPKDAFYNSKYPSCIHTYSGAGVCSKCGYKYPITINIADSGTYKVVKDFTPRTDRPYDDATKDTVTIKANTELEVLGSTVNAYGSKWYKFSYNGKIGYVYHDYLQFAGYGAQEITCTITSPKEGETVPKAAYPVIGTVTSKYPLQKVQAYLDGNLFATVNLGSQYTLDLRSSAINSNLNFASLSSGSHTLIIKAHDIHRSTPVEIIKRNFITEGSTAPKMYNVRFDANGGVLPAAYKENTLDGINVDRAAGFLVVYNNGGTLLDTNKYGVEILVDSTGKVIGLREYLSETDQIIPVNGFILSGQGKNGSWVEEIPMGHYVAYDTTTMKVYVYDTKAAHDANHRRIISGNSIGSLPTPTKTGYSFLGWYTAASGGTKVTSSYAVTADMTLYAHWQETKKEVHVSTNSVTLTLGETGSTVIAVWPSGYFSNSYYVNCNRSNSNVSTTWGQWGDDGRIPLQIIPNSMGTTTLTISLRDSSTNETFDSVTVNVTVNAKEYTISYNANGGTGAPSSQTKYHGTTLTLSSTRPTRPGYEFLGWSTSSTATAAMYQPGDSYVANKNTTLYAVWKENEITGGNSGKIAVYRLYNPYTHEHLLTGGEQEKRALLAAGWSLDGVAWNAPESGAPVYRLYNPYDDWHTYTVDENEKAKMVAAGWTVDGAISCSAPAATGRPIYRLFNPYVQTNFHLFTAGEEERDMLVDAGWILEGIAWYAVN